MSFYSPLVPNPFNTLNDSSNYLIRSTASQLTGLEKSMRDGVTVKVPNPPLYTLPIKPYSLYTTY
jgi:hypothetical protein